MKVLMLSNYYKPEITASSHLGQDRREAFSEAGFNMVLYTPVPTRGISAQVREEYSHRLYEVELDGKLHVHRFPLMREGKNPIQRAFRYFLSICKLYRAARREKNVDVLFIGSTPPINGLMFHGIRKKLNCKIVYNLQDVFPDSLVTTGMTKKGSLLWRIGRKIENVTYSYADRIIVISQSMKRNIMAKGVPEEKIEVISNWIDTDAVKPVAKEDNRLYEEFSIDREKFTVVYAGNFGAAQGAEVVLECAKCLPDVQFVIFGGGAGFDSARKTAESLPNVIINNLLPQERVPEVYSLGDVCLITCKKGVGTSGMPSKTWSIMACNTPIVAAFDTDSELAEIIEEANAGICVEPENADLLVKAITETQKNITQYAGGRAYACQNASKTVCVKKYVDVLKTQVESKDG